MTRRALLACLLLVSLVGPGGLTLPSAAGAAPAGSGGLLTRIKARTARWRADRTTERRLRAIDPLLVPAYRALDQAHAPYSHVHTGAAALAARPGLLGLLPGRLGKRLLAGFNSESAGDVQLCGEQAALARVSRKGAARRPVERLAVISRDLVPRPCGRCLQALSDVGSPATEVVTANAAGTTERHLLAELLPQRFARASRQTLAPFRPLLARAVRAYRAAARSKQHRYRPQTTALVQSDGGTVELGTVLKTSAATFTTATRAALDRLAQRGALQGRTERARVVVIVGRGVEGSDLPLPTGDERQQLLDANPQAQVVLYNPWRRSGAVLQAQQLLPFGYQRDR